MALQLSESWKLAKVALILPLSNLKALKSTEPKEAKDMAKVQRKACLPEILALRILEIKESTWVRKSLQREETTAPWKMVSTSMVWMNSGIWKEKAREDQVVVMVEEDHMAVAVAVELEVEVPT